jgi:hypothetical protein
MSVVNHKAKLITKSTLVTKPLETFMSSIGITESVDLYMYMDRVYVGINPILSVLSVDAKTFKKKAESPLHYITIKNNMYVNKYGLIKILADSREVVAFKFIDYIFEIIYKLETNGSVSIEDLSSRDELIKTLKELNLYKSTELHNISLINSIEDELKQYKSDLEITECENRRLLEENHTLEDQLITLQDKYTIVQDSAKKLALYAKFTKPTSKKQEILDKLSNTDEEIASELSTYVDTSDDEHIDDLKAAAISAKKQITAKVPKSTLIVDKVKYYILQSTTVYFNDDRRVYKWKITNTLPESPNTNTNFKDYSKDYRLGGIKTVIDYIWFNDIIQSVQIFKMINIIFTTVVYLDEEQVNRLIN